MESTPVINISEVLKTRIKEEPLDEDENHQFGENGNGQHCFGEFVEMPSTSTNFFIKLEPETIEQPDPDDEFNPEYTITEQ